MSCDNTRACPCWSETCTRKGKCCACVEHHRLRGNLPVCLRPVAEKMLQDALAKQNGDRSEQQ